MISSYDSTIVDENHQYETSKQRTIKIWNVDYLNKSKYGYSYNDILSCIFPSYEDKIEEWSFNNQQFLEYAAGSGITSIGSNAFYCCYNLSSVSFPNATSIGSYAFYSCSSLSSVSFPNATSIGSNAFYYCSKLSSITVNNSTLKSGTNGYGVNNAAVYSVDGKQLIVFSPGLNRISNDVVLSVSSNAFYSCSRLLSVSFPNATSISSWAFSYCSNLSSVSFPNVTSIGPNAFSYCSNLSSVSFPNATSIGGAAFYRCLKLSSIYLTSPTIATLQATTAFSNLPSNFKIYVPKNLYLSYIYATNWKSFWDHIEGIVIEEKDISKLDMTFPDKVVLDGSASYTPVPTIIDSYGNPLVNGTDFICTYSNNTGIGTATCTITGIGTFNGTVVKTFEIVEFEGTKLVLEIDNATGKDFGIYTTTMKSGITSYNIDWGD